MVDTGADISALPPTLFKPDRFDSNRSLTSANNSPIEYLGVTTLKFQIKGFKDEFQWTFAVAAVSKPILGADFLAKYNFNVSCHLRKIFRSDNNEISEQSISTVKSDDTLPPTHTHLYINTDGLPISQSPRKLFGERYAATKEEFNKLLKEGVIRPSKSEWASPLVVVKKSDGSWRACGDYRLLNEITRPDKYPLPRINDILDGVVGSKIFTKLDLRKAYHQIPIHPEDIPKTAVATPFGLYEYVKMPFGLRNASQTFQRHMDEILKDTKQYCLSYIDDILIFSASEGEHTDHLKEVLKRLDGAHLVINKEKCEFSKENVDFLGFNISKNGIKPTNARNKAIQLSTEPNNVKELRRFIGGIGYYHWLIPNLSEVLAPLHELVTKSVKNHRNYLWNSDHEKAFKTAKKLLASITHLIYPNPKKPFILSTDASGIAVGASLNQMTEENKCVPTAFFSRKLTDAEKKYSTFDRELLAAYLAVKHFKHYLEGSTFTINVDHKPLLRTMHMKDPSPRQWRLIEFLSRFNFEWQYIKGQDNLVADWLSRPNSKPARINTTINLIGISTDTLRREQHTDQTLRTLKNSDLQLCLTDNDLIVDTTLGHARVVLPRALRYQEFERLHNLSHPGPKPTTNLIKERYVWPRMNRDISEWCRACQKCQMAKISRHTKAPLGKIETKGRFHTVHLDIVGPLPVVNNKRYILTMIDRGTSWVEAIPIYEITSEIVIRTFEKEWISRFGVPEIAITDQGLQFQSDKFKEFCKNMGIESHRTTAYHPQSNGKVERWHRAMKNSIRAYSDNASRTWAEDLPKILLSLRNCTRREDKPSAAQLTFGQTTRLPGDFTIEKPIISDEDNLEVVESNINDTIQEPPEKKQTERPSYVSKLFTSCKKVWMRSEFRKSLENPYTGPYRIIEISPDHKTIKIDINGNEKVVSIDRLKPCVENDRNTLTM